MRRRALAGLLSLGLSLPWLAPRLEASYAFYVGRELTADGSVLIGGTGEEVSSHWLELVPARDHPPGSTVTVGVTGEAHLPGELIEIPQVRHTYRYLTMNYTEYKGLPPPLTNGGLNEHQVAIRDVWAEAREELVRMTPVPQRGPNYSDLARLALERARTAREAIQVMGALIDRHGYSSYGGNSHLVADPNEGWVMLELPGGQGLWAARRLGPREVRVSYPGYLGEIPADYMDDPNFMGSPHLISFAEEQGWYDPDRDGAFHFHRAYNLQGRQMRRPGLKYVDPKTIEDELMARAGEITLADFRAVVRDPRLCDDEAGYGQVAHLRRDLPHPELATLWVAPTGSVTAPFVPFRIGVQEIPPELRQHRYLTKGAARTFLNPAFQLQEATEFAGRTFKRLMYFTLARPEVFLPEVTDALGRFEAGEEAEQPALEETARILFEAGRPDLARRALTFYSRTRSQDALRLGQDLLGSVEARSRLLGPIEEPPAGTPIHAPDRETVNPRTSLSGEPPLESFGPAGSPRGPGSQ